MVDMVNGTFNQLVMIYIKKVGGRGQQYTSTNQIAADISTGTVIFQNGHPYMHIYNNIIPFSYYLIIFFLYL